MNESAARFQSYVCDEDEMARPPAPLKGELEP